MPKQMTFASLAHATKKKVTRREKFLSEKEAVVPWSWLLVLMRTPLSDEGHKGDDRIPPSRCCFSSPAHCLAGH